MPSLVVQDTCFGFRNRMWTEGEKIFIRDDEMKLLPRDKDGNIVHFVAEEKYIPTDPATGGRSPISPNGTPGKLDRKIGIAMAPDTAAATGGIRVDVGEKSARAVSGSGLGSSDVSPDSIPPDGLPVARSAGRPKGRK